MFIVKWNLPGFVALVDTCDCNLTCSVIAVSVAFRVHMCVNGQMGMMDTSGQGRVLFELKELDQNQGTRFTSAFWLYTLVFSHLGSFFYVQVVSWDFEGILLFGSRGIRQLM